MAKGQEQTFDLIYVPPEYWDWLQTTLQRAIGGCNDIASSVEVHQRLGLHSAEKLLDDINGQVREVRKLLEAIEVPF